MNRKCGIYEQGAMFSRNDFEPYKTIKYFFKIYGLKLSKKLEKRIKNNSVSDADFDYLCHALDINPTEKNLQSLCVAALNPFELNDLFLPDSEVTFENKMVHAKLFEEIDGLFMFDDEDKPHEHVKGDCLMLCFNIPNAWNIRDAIIPGDKRIAVFQIQEATKSLLKDNINWEERIGCLYAVG